VRHILKLPDAFPTFLHRAFDMIGNFSVDELEDLPEVAEFYISRKRTSDRAGYTPAAVSSAAPRR
jgi:copper homeostasis protein CutC